MGYRSQIVIAIDLSVYNQHKANKTVPAALVEEKHNSFILEDGDKPAIYFHLDGWKWYEDAPDVMAILDWFTLLEKEEELAQLIRPKVASQWRKSTEKIYVDEQAPYGFMRTGEEKDDIEELGEPYEFDMQIHVEIISPMDYS